MHNVCAGINKVTIMPSIYELFFYARISQKPTSMDAQYPCCGREISFPNKLLHARHHLCCINDVQRKIINVSKLIHKTDQPGSTFTKAPKMPFIQQFPVLVVLFRKQLADLILQVKALLQRRVSVFLLVFWLLVSLSGLGG